MHHLSRVMKSCKFIFVVREATAADLAQLAEQLICNQPVVGSNPTVGFSENLIATSVAQIWRN